MTDKIISWGILGTGKIACKFADDLLLTANCRLAAVASRSVEKAQTFAAQYKGDSNFPLHYGSYAELLEDETIDVVYIALPHVFHYENSIMCLEAGKAVLCEKPMGMNKHQVQSMVDLSRKNNAFLMEAMWTRFIPTTQDLVDLVDNGVLGEIISLKADFGFKANHDPDHRLFNKKLGGGSLLDIGIYPIYLSLLLNGPPLRIEAEARWSKTGVDSYIAMMFSWENKHALLEATLEATTPTHAYIHGTDASVCVPSRFHHSSELSILKDGAVVDTLKNPVIGHGYSHEIIEVNDCLRQGKIESDKMSHSHSLALVTTLDRVRKEIGLRYETDE